MLNLNEGQKVTWLNFSYKLAATVLTFVVSGGIGRRAVIWALPLGLSVPPTWRLHRSGKSDPEGQGCFLHLGGLLTPLRALDAC